MSYYDYELGDDYYRHQSEKRVSLREDRCEKCRLSDAMDEHPRVTEEGWVWCYWDGVKVKATHSCGYFKNWAVKNGRWTWDET